MGHGDSRLTPSTVNEIASSTEFSEKEIQQWYKSFQKQCPSGMLSQIDFKVMYGQVFPNGNAENFAEHTFRTFDEDKNGTINFREFMTALSVTSRGSVDDKLKWAFNMYDVDLDGGITKDEMLEVIKAIYKMVGNRLLTTDKVTPQQRVDEIFSKMDKDHDDKITAEEFTEVAKQDPSLVMLLQTGGAEEC